MVRAAAVAVAVSVAVAMPAGASADEGAAPGALDEDLLASIQGLLAVQRLDGWLLYGDGDRNPIARELVGPAPGVQSRWFYYIPAAGEPVAIARAEDARSFASVPGELREYEDYEALQAALASELAGADALAMEHDPESGIPSMSRVDAGTIDLVRSLGVRVRSSADLVQNTVARWLPEGRRAHYLAVHHLAALRDEALALVAERVAAGEDVTERDVQRAIERGYELRGLGGPPPRVAIGAHAANPDYRPTDARAAPIRRGDFLLLDLAARVEGAARPVYAELAWVAYVGEDVPAAHRELFAAASGARDAAIELLRERVEAGLPVRGHEVARVARDAAREAGFEDALSHRTGHSLGVTLPGHGAHLSGGESPDARPIVSGTGVSVGPGLYVRGEAGVRAQVGAYVSGRELEITGPIQRRVTALLSP